MRTTKQIDKSLSAAYIEINNLVALMFTKKNLNEFMDNTEDFLINAYIKGATDTLDSLGRDTTDIDELGVIPDLQTALNHVDGNMTYRNRIILGFFEYSTKEMQRLVGNEYHRMYNTGSYDVAKKLEQQGYTIMKRWHTMKDEKVRDTHIYLEGDRVPLDEKFYTWDGDSALYPGGFSKPENDIGCRCRLTFEEI